MLAERCGRPIALTAVSARDQSRDRGVDLSGVPWFDDAMALATEADCDVVVELIGGSDGIARDLTEAAFAQGRHVVTANKALMAEHGIALADRGGGGRRHPGLRSGGGRRHPDHQGVARGAGGEPHHPASPASSTAPATTSCRPCATVAAISRIVLDEAQAHGYAEADPSFDIDGVDAAHKLAILAAIAFNTRVAFDSGACRGHPPCLGAGYRLRRGARLSHQAAGPGQASGRTASRCGSIPAWFRRRRDRRGGRCVQRGRGPGRFRRSGDDGRPWRRGRVRPPRPWSPT